MREVVGEVDSLSLMGCSNVALADSFSDLVCETYDMGARAGSEVVMSNL